jgi:hypothetical protein
MVENKRSLIPGILFIVIGLWLFARRFFFFTPYWICIYPIILIFFAILLFIETSRRHHSGSLFWGVVLLSVGGFFFLRNFGIIPYFYADEYWPIFLLCLGMGFIALYILNPRDWGIIIPAGLFLFFGIGFSLHTFHAYFWGWERFIENYWPMILIVIGLGVLIRGFLPPQKN